MIRNPVQSVRRRLAGYSWLSDLPAMLCWAVLVGVLGAFATIAFHEGMRLIQKAVTGESGSIVGVMRGLPWYGRLRSEEHTSELQSLMRISYAVFCMKK